MTSPACPTGNGEVRGPESAGAKGTPLPGSRPDRARANNARNADFLGQTPVSDQAGFGTEDMCRPANYLSATNDWCEDPAPDLAAMGDGGETFGGS